MVCSEIYMTVLWFLYGVGAWERVGTMPRSSRTGYYQISEAPSDSEGLEPTDHVVTPRNLGEARDSRVGRTLRSVRERWRQRKEIRDTLPTFRPWFTFIVALVNVGMFVAVLITNGFAAITFTPKQQYGNVENFDGQLEPVVREEPANFFIGPTATDLVHHGAKYAMVSSYIV